MKIVREQQKLFFHKDDNLETLKLSREEEQFKKERNGFKTIVKALNAISGIEKKIEIEANKSKDSFSTLIVELCSHLDLLET